MILITGMANKVTSFFVFLFILVALPLMAAEEKPLAADKNLLQSTHHLAVKASQLSTDSEYAIWITTQTVPQPGKAVTRMDDVTVHAEEFYQYIRFISGFQASKDLLQRTLAFHTTIAILAAQNHPPVFSQLVTQVLPGLETGSDAYQNQVAKFIDAQAELFTSFRYYANKAKSQNALEKESVKLPLEYAQVNAKARCLKNIIHLLPANIVVEGLQKRLADLSPTRRTHLVKQALEYKETKSNLQEKTGLWDQYFNDLRSRTTVERPYQKIDSMYEKKKTRNGQTTLVRIPPGTPVAKVGQRTITFQQVMATQGRISRDKEWQLTKEKLVEPMIRTCMLANEFDRLKLPAGVLQNHLSLQKEIFLAIHQIKLEIGRKAFGSMGMDIFELKRRLQMETERAAFFEAFYKDTASLSDSGSLWIDSEYLKSLGWTIDIIPINQLDSQQEFSQ